LKGKTDHSVDFENTIPEDSDRLPTAAAADFLYEWYTRDADDFSVSNFQDFTDTEIFFSRSLAAIFHKNLVPFGRQLQHFVMQLGQGG
jgi:hypothetical protein